MPRTGREILHEAELNKETYINMEKNEFISIRQLVEIEEKMTIMIQGVFKNLSRPTPLMEMPVE